MFTDTVMRFVALRGLQEAEGPDRKLISPPPSTPLLTSLSELGEDRREAEILQLCLAFIESDEFVSDPDSKRQEISDLLASSNVGEAKRRISETWGTDPQGLLASEKNLIDSLWDTMHSLAKTRSGEAESYELITENLIFWSYIAWLVWQEDEEENISPEELATWTPLLSELIYVLDIDSNAVGVSANTSVDQYFEEAVPKLAQIGQYFDAAEELSRFDKTLSSTETSNISEETGDEGEDGKYIVKILAPPVSWSSDPEKRHILSDSTQTVLGEIGSYTSDMSVPEIVELLRDAAVGKFEKLMSSIPSWVAPHLTAEYGFRKAAQITGRSIYRGLLKSDSPVPVGAPIMPGIKSISIGDLMLVRERLLSYELGEVAHIANILKTEKFNREYVKVKETEDTITVETEVSEENEHSLETTERFEVQKEVEKVINSERNNSSGVKVTASYGAVSMTARTDVASKKTKQNSIKEASKFARETSEKAISNITKSMREERVKRVLQRTEDRAEHGFDNSNGPDHVVGVYRWINKKYKNYLVNYGRRLMVEMVIPEPAAFYSYASTQQNDAIGRVKPEFPTINGRKLKSKDLTKYNYQDYTSQYSIAQIPTYPQPTKKSGIAIVNTPNPGGNKSFSVKKDFQVDEGYEVRYGYGRATFIYFRNRYILNVNVSGQDWQGSGERGATGKVPISMTGSLSSIDLNYSFVMEPTESKIDAWQNSSFSKIVEAYNTELSAYYESIQAEQIQSGQVDFAPRDGEQTAIQMEELKKGAIRVLGNNLARIRIDGEWRYNEVFDSMMDNGGHGFPEFDVAESGVEGAIISFFENAFEWENVTYEYFPYHWARKEKWTEIVNRSSANPQFSSFLKAGAAKVVVPVSPAFEKAVVHYLETREVWDGSGDAPTIDNEKFKLLHRELQQKTEYMPGDVIHECEDGENLPCTVRTWESQIPTSLVYLQEDASLPKFPLPDIEFNLEGYLDSLVGSQELDWRSSVVDLLKALSMQSDKSYRISLAVELGWESTYSPSMNVWLHAKILAKLVATNGEWRN